MDSQLRRAVHHACRKEKSVIGPEKWMDISGSSHEPDSAFSSASKLHRRALFRLKQVQYSQISEHSLYHCVDFKHGALASIIIFMISAQVLKKGADPNHVIVVEARMSEPNTEDYGGSERGGVWKCCTPLHQVKQEQISIGRSRDHVHISAQLWVDVCIVSDQLCRHSTCHTIGLSWLLRARLTRQCYRAEQLLQSQPFSWTRVSMSMRMHTLHFVWLIKLYSILTVPCKLCPSLQCTYHCINL